MTDSYRSKEPLSQLAPEALDAYIRWGTTVDASGVHLACRPEIEATIFEVSAAAGGAAATRPPPPTAPGWASGPPWVSAAFQHGERPA